MKYKRDMQKQREYQKAWRQERRNKWLQENGPCKHCGIWIELQVDHIDESKKLISASSLWSRSEKVRLAELEKCQVLCKRCHMKKTSAFYEKTRKHGTELMYSRGCRCRPCTDQAVINVNEYRWKKGLRKKRNHSGVVQLVERCTVNAEVAGPSPAPRATT